MAVDSHANTNTCLMPPQGYIVAHVCKSFACLDLHMAHMPSEQASQPDHPQTGVRDGSDSMMYEWNGWVSSLEASAHTTHTHAGRYIDRQKHNVTLRDINIVRKDKRESKSGWVNILRRRSDEKTL